MISDQAEPAEKDEASGDEEILEVARERFKEADEAFDQIHRDYLEDIKFAAGEQWDPQVQAKRRLEARPCLTVNRLPQAIHQITNDSRQNKPAIRVSPVDDGADIETAKKRQGLIRHIEQASNADVAYFRALNCAVRGGIGYYRIVTEYCDPMSFFQDIRIKSIRNPLSVRIDPFFQEPDGSDINWAFVYEDLEESEFRRRYPKAKLSGLDDWFSLNKEGHSWFRKNSARVSEYFYKEWEDAEIVLLSDGNILRKSDFELGLTQGAIPPEVVVRDTRTTQISKVCWIKMNGIEILERGVLPGSGRWIPVVPVLGEEIDVDGELKLESIVRHAKDPARMYNVFTSSEAEVIGLSPKAPFVAAAGQIERYPEWQSANRETHAVLRYDPVEVGGNALPPPQRNVFEAPVQAISNARLMSSEDLKATTGVYDAAMGARSNETSGKAIQRRAAQAQTSNFHFNDNLNKSIRHGGRIIDDWIPHVYDTARTVRILGDEGQEETIRINEEFMYQGQPVTFDMSAGKYDITISTGPSFETKRQEAVDGMIALVQANPQVSANVLDLMVKNMDWPGAHEIAERFKKMLPPGLAEDKEKKPIPPELQAQMQQMQQVIDQLTEQLNHKNQQIENKSLELESKERIATMQEETKAAIELAKLQSLEAQKLLLAQMTELNGRFKQLGGAQPFPQSQNGMGPQEATPNQQQPTGGFPPGQDMGVSP